MSRKNLTEAAVERIKPPTDRQFVNYPDAFQPGLVLRVSSKGRKTWVAQYPIKSVDADGNRTTILTTKKLGLYPTLKVKEARAAAAAFLHDPQKAKAKADTGSFKEVAENFIKRHVEANKLRTRDDIVRLFNTHIYPHWANRPFRDIRRGDVAELLDHIEDNNGKRQADVCLAHIRKCMHWFASRNEDYSSPIVKGMNRYNAKEHKRQRVLNDDEIRALWNACTGMGTFGALVKTLLLTGQRREVTSIMKWDNVVDGEWIIPYAPRQKTNAGKLRLPPVLLGIIEAQPRIAGNPYVFAARGIGPFNSFSQRTEELNAKLPVMPAWILHDLRRTAKTLMARAGVRPDISERVLGHTIKGVEGVYDVHDYSDEKADALVRLAAQVEKILNPPEGNVEDIAQARTRKRASK